MKQNKFTQINLRTTVITRKLHQPKHQRKMYKRFFRRIGTISSLFATYKVSWQITLDACSFRAKVRSGEIARIWPDSIKLQGPLRSSVILTVKYGMTKRFSRPFSKASGAIN